MAVVDAVNTASPQTWYVNVDHLHRPIRMTNATKAVMWSATWTPWGSPHAITGAATLDARFPGQWFQLESSLHYNWHRHYDPTLGRYTQPDPLGFVDGPSVYGYVRGLVSSIVDPRGLQSEITIPLDRLRQTPYDYDDRVTLRRDPFHNFPYSYDPQIVEMGNVCSFNIVPPWKPYVQYCAKGYLNGTPGRYEVGFDVDLLSARSVCVHRFFRPSSE